MSTGRRAYQLKARAERVAETRRRIVTATEELHQEVGPAATTVAEIARRAGVSRLTVYNHFPDESDLFAACSAQFLERHPLPDLTAALTAGDPSTRVRRVLEALYGWWRETEAMSGNIQRDRRLIPALDDLVSRTNDASLDGLAAALAAGFERPGRARGVEALIRVALDFWTWNRLVRSGLAGEEAAALLSVAIACVARGA